VSLRTETGGAAALLDAAGIDARIEVDLPDLPRPAEEVLAWAVREGITQRAAAQPGHHVLGHRRPP
jgi:two-component system, NarL family, sensor histidine kinase DesK